METDKKDNHGNCIEHAWPHLSSIESVRSIGKTKIFACNNCLAIKVIQQKSGWNTYEPVETIVEYKDSAYSYVGK
jgi:hypothetical protein